MYVISLNNQLQSGLSPPSNIYNIRNWKYSFKKNVWKSDVSYGSQRLSLSALVSWPWKPWWTIEPDLLAILYLAIGLTNAKHCSVFKNVTLFFLKLPCQLFISHDFSKPSSPALLRGRGGRGSIADVWSSWWWFGALKLVPVLDFAHFRHAKNDHFPLRWLFSRMGFDPLSIYGSGPQTHREYI